MRQLQMDNEDDYINIDLSTMASTDTITVNVSSITGYDSTWNIMDDNIDLSSLNISTLNPVIFKDYMPDVAKVEDMCNDYPALEKAYENFKTIYKMVQQDWQGKQDEKNGKIF